MYNYFLYIPPKNKRVKKAAAVKKAAKAAVDSDGSMPGLETDTSESGDDNFTPRPAQKIPTVVRASPAVNIVPPTPPDDDDDDIPPLMEDSNSDSEESLGEKKAARPIERPSRDNFSTGFAKGFMNTKSKMATAQEKKAQGDAAAESARKQKADEEIARRVKLEEDRAIKAAAEERKKKAEEEKARRDRDNQAKKEEEERRKKELARQRDSFSTIFDKVIIAIRSNSEPFAFMWQVEKSKYDLVTYSDKFDTDSVPELGTIGGEYSVSIEQRDQFQAISDQVSLLKLPDSIPINVAVGIKENDLLTNEPVIKDDDEIDVVEILHQGIENIEFSNSTVRWLEDRRNSQYLELFLARIKMLSSGHRSYAYAKRLEGCKYPLFETKLDAGMRILWTQLHRDREDRSIMVCFIIHFTSSSNYIF